jgi:hypothetical protein
VTVAAIIGHGELLLVTFALVLPVLATVVMSEMGPGWRGTLAIALFVALGAAAILYGSFASQDAPDEDYVVFTSLALYAVLLLTAGFAMATLRRASR